MKRIQPKHDLYFILKRKIFLQPNPTYIQMDTFIPIPAKILNNNSRETSIRLEAEQAMRAEPIFIRWLDDIRQRIITHTHRDTRKWLTIYLVSDLRQSENQIRNCATAIKESFPGIGVEYDYWHLEFKVTW